MNSTDNLASLEILRDFVARAVPCDVYLKNLVIDGIETCNRRLWALRESMRVDETAFAVLLSVDAGEYRGYEKDHAVVPPEFLDRVAGRLAVPVEWLRCERSFLPMPNPRI